MSHCQIVVTLLGNRGKPCYLAAPGMNSEISCNSIPESLLTGWGSGDCQKNANQKNATQKTPIQKIPIILETT